MATPYRLRFDVGDALLRDSFLRTFFFGALDDLTASDRPRWGKMTAQQMVEHLVWTFELSTGRAEVDSRLPEAQLERMRSFLYNDRPTPQEFMNPALRYGLPRLRFPDVKASRDALREEVDRFLYHAREEPAAVHVHPVYGTIGMEDWSRSHFKHSAHHLLQFGRLHIED